MHPVALDMLLERVVSGEFMPHATSPAWICTLGVDVETGNSQLVTPNGKHTSVLRDDDRSYALQLAMRRAERWRRVTEQLNLWTPPSRL